MNAARDIQKQRFSGTNITCNAQMTPAMVGEFCTLDAAGEKLLKGAFERLGLTARSHDRLLRVARTIADLDAARRSRRIIWPRPSSTATRIFYRGE